MGKTRIKNKDREDFSELLKELQGKDKPMPKVEKNSDEYDMKINKDFQRMLSDERVLYLVEKSQNIIHDKHCEYAQAVEFAEIEGSNSYDFNANQCPHCELRAYLRIGAEDYKKIKNYEKLFEKMNADISLIRKLYVEMGCTTKLCEFDTIHIIHGEEAWKIKAINNHGRVELWHNDYRLSYYGECKRFNTYHIQSEGCRNTSTHYAVEVISRHKQHRAYCEYTIREQQVIRLIKFNPKETQKNMADMLGVSVSTIRKIMQSLKDSETISRIGESRNGYWKVTM